jgi:hypothetical protein
MVKFEASGVRDRAFTRYQVFDFKNSVRLNCGYATWTKPAGATLYSRLGRYLCDKYKITDRNIWTIHIWSFVMRLPTKGTITNGRGGSGFMHGIEGRNQGIRTKNLGGSNFRHRGLLSLCEFYNTGKWRCRRQAGERRDLRQTIESRRGRVIQHKLNKFYHVGPIYLLHSKFTQQARNTRIISRLTTSTVPFDQV